LLPQFLSHAAAKLFISAVSSNQQLRAPFKVFPFCGKVERERQPPNERETATLAQLNSQLAHSHIALAGKVGAFSIFAWKVLLMLLHFIGNHFLRDLLFLVFLNPIIIPFRGLAHTHTKRVFFFAKLLLPAAD
jgi:hypothetical protein